MAVTASTAASAVATSFEVDVNPTTVVDEEKTFSNDPVDTAAPLNEAVSVVSVLCKEE